MNKNLYTQMQIANDAEPVQITSREWNDGQEDCDMCLENMKPPVKTQKNGLTPKK